MLAEVEVEVFADGRCGIVGDFDDPDIETLQVALGVEFDPSCEEWITPERLRSVVTTLEYFGRSVTAAWTGRSATVTQYKDGCCGIELDDADPDDIDLLKRALGGDLQRSTFRNWLTKEDRLRRALEELGWEVWVH
jgi:hypothetical protein